MSYKSIKLTSHRDKLKRYATGGSAVKAVKKHEKNMHPDAEPTKFARGGKVKTPSISITVNTTRNDAPVESPMDDMGAAEMSAPPPMPPPEDMGMGEPPPPDMGMMPPDPGLGAPPMFKRGGTVRGTGVTGKNTTAGSGSGLGRLQKIGKAPPTAKR